MPDATAGAVGDAGAAGAAAGTPVAAGATTVAVGATPAVGTTVAPAWYESGGIKDAEMQGYIKNKGWDGLENTVKSYQSLEKLVGVDPNMVVRIPRGDDSAGLKAVMTKLGMPLTADKYSLDMPKDMPISDKYVSWARNAFHAANLTDAQAASLSKANNEFIRQHIAAENAAYENQITLDKQDLLNTWRGGYPKMELSGQLAVKTLGFPKEVITAIEKTIGYKATMEMFAKLGQKFGEHKFVDNAGANKGFDEFSTTEESTAQWNALKLDSNFTKALTDPSHPGHKGAVEKQNMLFKLMYPTKA